MKILGIGLGLYVKAHSGSGSGSDLHHHVVLAKGLIWGQLTFDIRRTTNMYYYM